MLSNLLRTYLLTTNITKYSSKCSSRTVSIVNNSNAVYTIIFVTSEVTRQTVLKCFNSVMQLLTSPSHRSTNS